MASLFFLICAAIILGVMVGTGISIIDELFKISNKIEMKEPND